MPKSKPGLKSVWQAKTEIHYEGHPPVTAVGTFENEAEDDPWLKLAGIWRDDPAWELFQAEIQGYRSLVNAKNFSDQ